MKCMHVQEKAVSMEFSTVVISGVHCGSENVDNGGLLHSIVGHHISRNYFYRLHPFYPPSIPTSGNHQSVLSIYEFRCFFFFFKSLHISETTQHLCLPLPDLFHSAYDPQALFMLSQMARFPSFYS